MPYFYIVPTLSSTSSAQPTIDTVALYFISVLAARATITLLRYPVSNHSFSRPLVSDSLHLPHLTFALSLSLYLRYLSIYLPICKYCSYVFFYLDLCLCLVAIPFLKKYHLRLDYLLGYLAHLTSHRIAP
jgi:hypothetical protein